MNVLVGAIGLVLGYAFALSEGGTQSFVAGAPPWNRLDLELDLIPTSDHFIGNPARDVDLVVWLAGNQLFNVKYRSPADEMWTIRQALSVVEADMGTELTASWITAHVDDVSVPAAMIWLQTATHTQRVIDLIPNGKLQLYSSYRYGGPTRRIRIRQVLHTNPPMGEMDLTV